MRGFSVTVTLMDGDHQPGVAGARTAPGTAAPTENVRCFGAESNLVLIGFMGVGKSSIGRRLARQGSREFIDTDHLIEEREGRSIPQIFAADGEEHFRQLETAALENLLERGTRRAVIATGGGMVTIPRNVPLLQQLGLIVWLRAEEAVIFERVSRNENRPLLRTPNPRETMREMMEARHELYAAAADMIIDTSYLDPNDLAHAILLELERRGG